MGDLPRMPEGTEAVSAEAGALFIGWRTDNGDVTLYLSANETDK